MANNVKINGVIYNEVETVQIPLATDPSTLITFTDTSDADAVEKEITKGKTAYVNGRRLVGTHTDPTFSLTDGVLSIV